MNRLSAMVVVLALSLLGAGALCVTFADRVAGQSASSAASGPSVVPAASAPAASAPADGSIVEPFSTPIDNTGCDVRANDPHIATSDGPRRVKGFGEIVKYCNERKDYLRVEVDLFKKGNNGDTTWSLADHKVRDCTTCFHTGIGAERACQNRNDNRFHTQAYATVRNNGNVHHELGISNPVTLNCGGF